MSGEQPPKALLESVEASKAEYVQLGKSGLRVSIPIFGAMSFGTPEWAPWVIEEDKVIYLCAEAFHDFPTDILLYPALRLAN